MNNFQKLKKVIEKSKQRQSIIADKRQKLQKALVKIELLEEQIEKLQALVSIRVKIPFANYLYKVKQDFLIAFIFYFSTMERIET